MAKLKCSLAKGLTSILFVLLLLYLFILNLSGFWQYVRFGLYSRGVLLGGF
jgi:hypothetical protein